MRSLALACAALLAAASANLALAGAVSSATKANEAERAGSSSRPQPSKFATLITPDPDYEPLMCVR